MTSAEILSLGIGAVLVGLILWVLKRVVQVERDARGTVTKEECAADMTRLDAAQAGLVVTTSMLAVQVGKLEALVPRMEAELALLREHNGRQR